MDIPVGTLLKEWQSYITTISRNLMELSEHEDVKIIKLRVKDTANGYTGLTKAKAAEAVEDLDRLWRYYAVLSGVVDKANDLYSKNSFLRNTDNEVRELLQNTLVTLETEHVDISTRSLLGSVNKETKVNLQELLRLMQESFEATRNTLNEIANAAESMKSRLRAMRSEIEELNNTANRLGLMDMPLFDIDSTSKAESDPLKGISELDALYNSMERYRASIRSAERDYNETVDALNRVKSMLGEIEDLAEKSQKAYLESQKVFDTVQNYRPVLGQDVLKSLQDWLYVLEGKLSQGYLNATKIGAKRLEHECSLKLEAEKESYYINSKDYNEWLDLKGIYKALCAKLDGLKAKGLLFDSSLNVLIENIQASLYADKVNLPWCRQLIEKFHSSLRS